MVASALGSNLDPANLDQTEASRSLARLGIDVGGTFTDLVLLRDGQIQTAKVLSTPSPEEGVFAALDKLGALQGELRVDLFCHGMTVATNALLERKGSPTLFLTTAGFRDVLAIARQNRPSLYDLTQPKPEPVVPRHHCLEVKERCSAGGVLEPLTDAEIRRVVQRWGNGCSGMGSALWGWGFFFLFSTRSTNSGWEWPCDRLSRSYIFPCLARWRRSSANTSASAPPPSMPTSARHWRATCTAWPKDVGSEGSPSP